MIKPLLIFMLLTGQLCAQFISGGSRRVSSLVSGGATQVFTDSFSYSHGDLVTVSGGNWAYTTGATFLVTSPYLEPNQGIKFAFARWSGTGTPNTNQYATAHYFALGAGVFAPAVRVSTSGPNTGYAAACTSAGCFIVKIVAGAQTNLTSTGPSIATGDTIEIDATGTASTVLTIKRTHSGTTTTYQTVTDSSSPITTGAWGVGGYGPAGSGTFVDNVTGGNL